MKKIICILLLVSFCLMFCSCAKSSTNTTTHTTTYTVTFYGNENIYYKYVSAANKYLMYTNNNVPSVYKKTKIINTQYVDAPTPPVNDGYIFLGWYQDAECTEIFLFGYHQINSDINLYAKWGVGR